MKPPEKKWPPPKVAGPQPQRPATPAQPFKPAVAQSKSAAPASARPHRAAPPVYRSQAKPPVAQSKAAQLTPAAPVGRGFSVAAAPSSSQTMKAKPVVVQAKSATGRGALIPGRGRPARSLPAALPTGVIQRTMDFPPGFPGSGLTPDATDQTHGRWHIHAYSDSEDERKAKVFTKFHVKFITTQKNTQGQDVDVFAYVGFKEVNGAAVLQNSPQGMSAAQRTFASQKATAFLGTCAAVSAAEVAKRVKAYDDHKAALAAQAAAVATAAAAHQAAREAAPPASTRGLGDQLSPAERAYRTARRMVWMNVPSATRPPFEEWLAKNP